MEAYTAYALDDRSWRIEENGVRSFLFLGEKRALLVDTGFGTGDLRACVENLTNLPIILVNTHADRDHIGCNAQFAAAHMHPAEYDRYGAGDVESARPLWEGDTIDLGNRRFAVILIPGHTPGSIALLDEENRLLISGDSVQTGNIFMFGPGRNLPAYIASLEKLMDLRDSFDTVYPSHGNFPLSSDILPDLLEGSRRALAGEIPCTPAEIHGMAVRVCDMGVAKLLLPPKEEH